jgi:hypothetical protein
MRFRDRNGILFRTNETTLEMKKGCNTAKYPPPVKSTRYPRKRKLGNILGTLSDLWPSVK